MEKIEFEVSELLKKCGFNRPVNSYFDYDDEEPMGVMEVTSSVKKDWNKDPYLYSRPTLEEIMKWLREKHNIFIGVEPRLSQTDFYWITATVYKMENVHSIYHDEDVIKYTPCSQCDAHSFENAVYNAIKYSLKHLL